jgi:putative adhesin/cell wall-active antibiotic response 4TMS protein YvqF
MAYGRTSRSSIFSGLVLLSIGTLLLLHNYRGLEIDSVLYHWWPLLLIFWGAIKLYERTAGARSGDPAAARVTAGEILLVLGLLTFVGFVVAIDFAKSKLPGRDIGIEFNGDSHDFDVDVATKTVPPNARISIRNGHGDVSVRSSDDPEIHVSGKKSVNAWTDSDAERIANTAKVQIVQNGDGYEIVTPGFETASSRVAVDLDVVVPKKAGLTVRNEKGDVTISDMATSVSVTSLNGDVEVRDTADDVNIDAHRGDVKVSDTKGNVKISGKGGEINVVSATGGLTIDGEFYGPVRADKINKGMRFISQRTDLTLTQLSGHMELGSGNLEIADAPGNLTLRTNSYDVSIENAGGKVKIDNRNGNVTVRFSSPPKEDIDIANSSSGIDLSLPGSSSFEILADSRSGDINSEFSNASLKMTGADSGNTHLEGKYGSGRGPKITLKTSYGSISIHKTSGMVPPPLPKPPQDIPPAEEH